MSITTATMERCNEFHFNYEQVQEEVTEHLTKYLSRPVAVDLSELIVALLQNSEPEAIRADVEPILKENSDAFMHWYAMIRFLDLDFLSFGLF
jgi:hypothetical protein